MTLEIQPLFDAARRHWQERADAAPGGAPEAAAMRPEEMAQWMPHAIIVELDRLACDLRFRLVGTQIVSFYGREFTGMELTDLPFALDERNDDTRRVWWQAAERPVAAQGWARHLTAPGRKIVLDRLLLPYSGRVPGTRMLMVVQAPRLGPFGGWHAPVRPAPERGIERRAQPRPDSDAPSGS